MNCVNINTKDVTFNDTVKDDISIAGSLDDDRSPHLHRQQKRACASNH